MNTPKLASQQGLTFINYLDTGYSLTDLPIGMDDERESRESVLSAKIDDDEITY